MRIKVIADSAKAKKYPFLANKGVGQRLWFIYTSKAMCRGGTHRLAFENVRDGECWGEWLFVSWESE